MVADQRVVEGYTSCVYVNLFAVALARDLFWSHEKNRADFLLVAQLDSHSLFGSKAKIYDFELLSLRMAFRSKY